MSRKYVATYVKYVTTSVMNVIHIDRSYPLRWYVIIFVIATTTVAATALSRFGEVLGDYQVLCAQHKGPRISHCFEMYFFHVLSRLRRSAVKGGTRRRCLPLYAPSVSAIERSGREILKPLQKFLSFHIKRLVYSTPCNYSFFWLKENKFL